MNREQSIKINHHYFRQDSPQPCTMPNKPKDLSELLAASRARRAHDDSGGNEAVANRPPERSRSRGHRDPTTRAGVDRSPSPRGERRTKPQERLGPFPLRQDDPSRWVDARELLSTSRNRDTRRELSPPAGGQFPPYDDEPGVPGEDQPNRFDDFAPLPIGARDEFAEERRILDPAMSPRFGRESGGFDNLDSRSPPYHHEERPVQNPVFRPGSREANPELRSPVRKSRSPSPVPLDLDGFITLSSCQRSRSNSPRQQGRPPRSPGRPNSPKRSRSPGRRGPGSPRRHSRSPGRRRRRSPGRHTERSRRPGSPGGRQARSPGRRSSPSPRDHASRRSRSPRREPRRYGRSRSRSPRRDRPQDQRPSAKECKLWSSNNSNSCWSSFLGHFLLLKQQQYFCPKHLT